MQDNSPTPILGIDFGDRKIGLALSYGAIAEPLAVVRYETVESALQSIREIAHREGVTQIVMGVSERESEEKAIDFGERLSASANIPVVFQDETLSTKDAILLSREAGIKRKKRREMEDAYAATLILQSYLDSK